MQSSLPLAQLLPNVIAIARKASKAVMEVYERDEIAVTQKSDDSPLTAADTAANATIIDGLRQLSPILPIISEESLKHAADRHTSPAVWIVDPVDGTKEFIKRTGEFTVNIALVENGQPVLGVVVAPAIDTLYYGASGLGAFKQIGTASAQALTKQPPRTDPIVAISASHPSPETTDWMARHGFTQTKVAGSSLKICYVADGTVDVYPRLGPQSEWDIAAGDAVLRAAGGSLTVFDTSEPMIYNKKDMLTPYYIATLGLDL